MELANYPECKSCGHTIHGRTDKKFCNDYCRNSYNNKVNRSQNNTIRNITNALLRNRSILKHSNSKALEKTELLDKGFRFEYFTHTKSKNRKIFYYCYDWCYYLRNKQTVIIISSLENE
jgi:predicted nucleic acid-binding Zn ribbon protein